jgi:hypothetical protein
VVLPRTRIGAALVGALIFLTPALPAGAATTLSCDPIGEKEPSSTRPLLSGPEPILDESGEPARAYAGYFVEQAVASVGETVHVGYYEARTKRLTIASRTGSSGPWSFTQPTVADGSPVVLDGDTHNSITLVADPDGGLHLVANVHSSAMTYWSAPPGSGADGLAFADHLVITPRYNSAGVRTDDEGYVTYPRFFTGADGVFRLMFRAGWSDAGKTYLYEFDGVRRAWTNPLAGNALLDGWTGPGYSPYPETPVHNPADGMYYLAWTWQDTGSAASTSTVNMMRSADLRTWTAVGGAALDVPVRYGQPAALVDAAPEGSGLINGNIRAGVDSDGRPSLTYTRTVAGTTKLTVARRDGLNKNWVASDVSRWTGEYDVSDNSALGQLTLASGAVATGSGTTMTIGYQCNGQHRTAVVDKGKFHGQTLLVSDARVARDELPDALLVSEFAGAPDAAAYRITRRATTTATAHGTLVVAWESGPMIVNGGAPDPGSYPEAGSTLFVALLGRS